MKSMLLITNANIGENAGNSTLVLRRAKSIYDVYGIFTHIVLYNEKEQGTINNGDYYYDITFVKSYRNICMMVRKCQPSHIILYGDRISILSCPLKKEIKKAHITSKIVLDVQSCIEEKYEYAKTAIRKYVYYPCYYLLFIHAIRNVDAAFVVSDEQIDNCKKKRGSKNTAIEYYKIRCGTSEWLSRLDIESNRIWFRQNNKIPNDAIVFCFSGYRSKWQKIDEIIEIFKEYDKRIHNSWFAFFCNSDDSFMNRIYNAFPKGNAIIQYLGKDEYYRSLCGCDVGYILRDYNETNKVAFPNKFSDYIVCGMLIGINKALPEPMRILNNNGLIYLNSDDTIDNQIQIINEYIQNRNQYIEKSIMTVKNELLYSSQIKKIDFNM